jgi:hypothetical protein
VYSSWSASDAKEHKGLLISTHSKRAYTLRKGSSALQISESCIEIGNGEIRISKGGIESVIVQTEGNRNSAFEIGTNTIADIYGEAAQISGFELYQIELRSDKVATKS